MLYGAAYYPEHRNEDKWEYDLENNNRVVDRMLPPRIEASHGSGAGVEGERPSLLQSSHFQTI